MASLVGQVLGQTKIDSNGDVFHNLFRNTPHQVSNISPNLVQACDLHDGEWGTVGSVVVWSYVHDRKQKDNKCLMEAIDEENKSIVFKVIEGALVEEYKSFKVSIHVDTKGEHNLVTWTCDFEKLHENGQDPHTVLEFFIYLTKDIEAHHLQS